MNCRRCMSKTSSRLRPGIGNIETLARRIAQHVRQAGGAGAPIDGQNRAPRFGVAVVLKDTHRRDDVDGFVGLNEQLVGCRGTHGTRRRGAELRGHIGAVGPGSGAYGGGGGGGGQRLRGDRNPAAADIAHRNGGGVLRGGDTALVAGQQGHVGIGHRQRLIRSVPMGSTMKPDCEIA